MIQACHDIKRVRIKSSVATKKTTFLLTPSTNYNTKRYFVHFVRNLGFSTFWWYDFNGKPKLILDKIKAILKSSNRIYSKSPFLKFWVITANNSKELWQGSFFIFEFLGATSFIPENTLIFQTFKVGNFRSFISRKHQAKNRRISYHSIQ